MLPDYVRKPTVTPPPPPPPPPPPAPPARHVEHKVQRGETLSEISTRYRTTPRQIEDANPDLRQPDALAIGQTLRVPIGEGYGVEPIDREVKPGETLADLDDPNVCRSSASPFISFGQRRQAWKKAVVIRTFFQRTIGYTTLGGRKRRKRSAASGFGSRKSMPARQPL